MADIAQLGRRHFLGLAGAGAGAAAIGLLAGCGNDTAPQAGASSAAGTLPIKAVGAASGSLEAVAWYGGLDMDVAIDDPEQAWRMVAVLQKPIGR